jgi:hypothetical protein
MARHRRPRTLLFTVTALVAGWLTVLGTATAAPASTASATMAPATTDLILEEVSPLVAVPTGVYQIRPRFSYDSCLRAGPQIDPATGDIAVYVGSCNDAAAQWWFEPTDPAHGSQYMEVRSMSYNRCLDADNRSGRLTGIIHLYTCNQSPNQAWDFRGGTTSEAYACVAASPSCEYLLRSQGSFHTWGGWKIGVIRNTPEDTGGQSDRRWMLVRVG